MSHLRPSPAPFARLRRWLFRKARILAIFDDLDTLRQVVEGMERYFAKVAEDMIRLSNQGKPKKRREATKPTKRRRADVGGDDDDDDAGWETCSDDEEDDDA